MSREFRVVNDGYEMVPLARLALHPRNVNEGDVGAIHGSIAANGFYGAVVAQRSTGHVLAGNHRLIAAQQAGATELPVVWVDCDDAEALRILLADNRTTRLGMDDTQALADLLQEILADAGTLDGTGYDTDALDELLADLGREQDKPEDPGAQIDRAEELREKWGTERGQVWGIPSKTSPGKTHRLMCGDSTSAEDVGRLVGDARGMLGFTSPPYNAGDSAKLSGNMACANRACLYRSYTDDAPQAEWGDLCAAALHAMLGVCDAVVVDVQMLAGNKTAFLEWLYDWRDHVVDVAIWHKGHAAPHVAENVLSSTFEFLVIFSPKKNPTKAIPTASFRAVGNVYEGPPQRDNEYADVHGATFPSHLPRWIIQTFSTNQSVIDVFCGTGTTMVAAEQARRACFGMEIDPAYCAVILERMTGMGLEPFRITRDEANG